MSSVNALNFDRMIVELFLVKRLGLTTLPIMINNLKALNNTVRVI